MTDHTALRARLEAMADHIVCGVSWSELGTVTALLREATAALAPVPDTADHDAEAVWREADRLSNLVPPAVPAPEGERTLCPGEDMRDCGPEAALAAARAEAERLQQEMAAGRAFYELTVAQRNAAWAEADALRQRMAQFAEHHRRVEEEKDDFAELLYAAEARVSQLTEVLRAVRFYPLTHDDAKLLALIDAALRGAPEPTDE
jgi:hypothetical protein